MVVFLSKPCDYTAASVVFAVFYFFGQCLRTGWKDGAGLHPLAFGHVLLLLLSPFSFFLLAALVAENWVFVASFSPVISPSQCTWKGVNGLTL